MQVLQAILIDDEQKALTALVYELQRMQQPAVKILASFTQAQDAIHYLQSPSGRQLDVVFLDIEMPGIDGLSFLDAFAQRSFDVIYTTAHRHYAIDAIRKGAFDYLVKPVDREELQAALARLVGHRYIQNGQNGPATAPMPLLGEEENLIRVEVDRKILFVDADDIIYCESDGNYCRVFLEQDDSLFLTKQLKALGQLLPPQRFLRVHKSYIVNLKKIKEYHRVEHYVLLSNGKRVPVSRQLWGYFMNQ